MCVYSGSNNVMLNKVCIFWQDKYRQIEDLYLTFAKKASAFNSWFENAEEDLTDPVRCNSVEEIKVNPSLTLTIAKFAAYC